MDIRLSEDIVNKVINNYIESMKEDLLKGKRVYIKGIGYLEPKYRKVKNDRGRDYAITIRLKQNKDFSKSIIESYNNDKSQFN